MVGGVVGVVGRVGEGFFGAGEGILSAFFVDVEGFFSGLNEDGHLVGEDFDKAFSEGTEVLGMFTGCVRSHTDAESGQEREVTAEDGEFAVETGEGDVCGFCFEGLARGRDDT